MSGPRKLAARFERPEGRELGAKGRNCANRKARSGGGQFGRIRIATARVVFVFSFLSFECDELIESQRQTGAQLAAPARLESSLLAVPPPPTLGGRDRAARGRH